MSAATANHHVEAAEIPQAEAAMRAMDQHPLFMVRPGEDDLDRYLQSRGYDLVDPVAIYVSPVELSYPDPRVDAIWPPDESTLALWATGGIGPARVAVMERATGEKTALLAIENNTTLGVAFVATSGEIAMLHALEVSPHARRRGIGTDIMKAASHWARENGASSLTLMVTRANTPANALYRGLGMIEVGHYHYRRAPQAKQ